jgi:ribonuclease P protein component
MASVCACGPEPGAPSFLPGAVRAESVWPAESGHVLGSESRIRRAGEFRDTMRQGVRSGRTCLVMHARRTEHEPSRAGFIVSKAVGKAVVRNRVKRQLRHLAAATLPDSPFPVDVVVRALPAAPGGDLAEDFTSAFALCLTRLAA